MNDIPIITKAPADIYGDDSYYVIFNYPTEAWRVNPENWVNYFNCPYVDWSILTDEERDTVWNEFGEECAMGAGKIPDGSSL